MSQHHWLQHLQVLRDGHCEIKQKFDRLVSFTPRCVRPCAPRVFMRYGARNVLVQRVLLCGPCWLCAHHPSWMCTLGRLPPAAPSMLRTFNLIAKRNQSQRDVPAKAPQNAKVRRASWYGGRLPAPLHSGRFGQAHPQHVRHDRATVGHHLAPSGSLHRA